MVPVDVERGHRPRGLCGTELLVSTNGGSMRLLELHWGHWLAT